MLILYKKLTTHYHMFFHLGLGLIVGTVFYLIAGTPSLKTYLFIGCIAAVLPDIEHVLFFYSYGKTTAYAKSVRNYVKAREYKKAADFCKRHHKDLECLYIHNGLTPLILLLLAILFVVTAHPLVATLLVSAALHYFYDIFEDFILMRRINSNWFLKFETWHDSDADSALQLLDNSLPQSN